MKFYQTGGTIGVASHVFTTVMVYEVQSESTREWTATDSMGLGLSSNSSVVALDFRPERGSCIIRLYQQMPHRQAGVLSGEAIQYGDNGVACKEEHTYIS